MIQSSTPIRALTDTSPTIRTKVIPQDTGEQVLSEYVFAPRVQKKKWDGA